MPVPGSGCKWLALLIAKQNALAAGRHSRDLAHIIWIWGGVEHSLFTVDSVSHIISMNDLSPLCSVLRPFFSLWMDITSSRHRNVRTGFVI
jgi:hypothetical protein